MNALNRNQIGRQKMEYEDIIYTNEEGIATIILNRPEAMNAFSPEMSESISSAVQDSAQDDSVRVIIITAKGRAFCTGADVKMMAQRFEQADEAEKKRLLRTENMRFPILFRSIDKPIIASINGLAVGGGFDFALSCDIRIASDKARFAEVFIRRGLIPALGGIFFIPRLAGVDKACELIWTGDMIDAKEAERLGLVTKVVSHDELEIATWEFAQKLAKGPPLAIQRAKRAIYESLSMGLETSLNFVGALSKDLMQSEDHKEGARAFLEKREPVFKGK